MGHQAVHRVSVRLRFDPAFVEKVYDDPERALRGAGLSEEERGWLLATDRRAWGVDPMLRTRTLRSLFVEFKGATAIAAAELRRLSALDAFFSSQTFHDTIQARGSLAAAYAAYLRGLHLQAPQLEPVLQLEEALAVCRRELERPPERLSRPPKGPWVARARGVGALSLPGGALESLNVVETYLFTVDLLPVISLCRDNPGLGPLPPLQPEAPRRLVLQPALGGSGLRELGSTVQEVLSSLNQVTRRPVALKRIAARGLGRERAGMLLRDLAGAGLIAEGG